MAIFWFKDLAASGPIWRAPWQQAHNRGGLKFYAAMLALLTLTVLSVSLWISPAAGLRVLTAVSCFLLIILWLILVGNLLDQNHPEAARSVPGQGRRLRVVAVTAWAGLSLAAATLATWVDASPWLFGSLAAAGLAALSAAMVRPQLIMLGWVAPLVVHQWQQRAPSPALTAAVVGAWSTHRALTTAVVVILSGLLVKGLAGDGGAAHRRQREVRRRLMRPRKGLRTGWVDKLFNPVGQRPYNLRLARLTGPGHATSPTLARMWLALGPAAQPITQLGQTLGALPVLGLIALLWLALMPPGFKQGLLSGLSIWGAVICLTAAVQTANALPQTRGEQALMRLCPGTPSGTTLNRGLVMHSMRWFGLSWLLGSGASLAVLYSVDIEQASWLQTLACLATLAAAAAPLGLLRDWSRAAATSAHLSLSVVWPTLVLGATLALLHGWAGWSMPTLAVFTAATVLLPGAWLWLRLQDAPCAWPTGRNAGRPPTVTPAR